MEQDLTIEQNFDPEVKQKASIYVPAIGKVTIVVLLRNLLRIVQNRLASSPRIEQPKLDPTDHRNI